MIFTPKTLVVQSLRINNKLEILFIILKKFTNTSAAAIFIFQAEKAFMQLSSAIEQARNAFQLSAFQILIWRRSPRRFKSLQVF